MNYIIPDNDAPLLNQALRDWAGNPCQFAQRIDDVWVYHPQHLAKAKKKGVAIDLDQIVVSAGVGFSTINEYLFSLEEAITPKDKFSTRANQIKSDSVSARTVQDLSAQVADLTEMVAELGAIAYR